MAKMESGTAAAQAGQPPVPGPPGPVGPRREDHAGWVAAQQNALGPARGLAGISVTVRK